jgi:thymidylate kinase
MIEDLICIIGPDGSGKSTQCELLEEEFKRRDIKYEYRWFRFRHYLTLPLLAFARVLGLSEVEELEDGQRVGYHYFWRSRVISYLYPRLLFLDMLLGYFIDIRPSLLDESKTVIADRYVYDTLVHIAISTQNPTIHQSAIGRLFLRLVPTKSTTVVLLAEPETLRERRADVEHDATLDSKVEQYRRLSSDLGLDVIDAAESPAAVQKQIQQRIFEER